MLWNWEKKFDLSTSYIVEKLCSSVCECAIVGREIMFLKQRQTKVL